MNTVGMRIVEARNIRGLSQSELAIKSGVALDLLLDYENGVIKPKMMDLFKLCNALDTHMTYLSGISDSINCSFYEPTEFDIRDVKLITLKHMNLLNDSLTQEEIEHLLDNMVIKFA